MIKRTLKRTLSIVLTLVLLATTFFIFDPSVLKMDAEALIGVETNAGLASITTPQATAPETIYIKPGSNTFQYFSNINVTDGVASGSKDGTGTVSYKDQSSNDTKLYVNHLWHKVGKTGDNYEDFTISNLQLGITGGVGAQQSITLAGLSATNATPASGATVIGRGSNSATAVLNTSSILNNATPGDVYMIEWAAVSTIAGAKHVKFLYTGIYVPLLTITGATARGRHTTKLTNVPKAAGFGFITGAMAYATKGNRTTAYTGTTWGVNCAPLVGFVGQQNNGNAGQYTIPNCSDGWKSETSFPSSGSPKTIMVVPGDYDANGNGNNYDVWTTYSSWGSYASPVPTGSNHGDVGKNGQTDANVYAGVAYEVVDTSRFTNFNQIPNLSAGFIRYYHDRGGDTAALAWARCSNAPDADAPSNGVTITGIDAGSEHNDNENKWKSRTYGLGQFSGATPTSSKGMYLMFRYNEDITVYDYPIQLNIGVGFHVTSVNKDNQRKGYCAYLESVVDNVNDSGFSTTYENMRTMARRLCDPTCSDGNTTSGCDATSINTKNNSIIVANSGSLYFHVPETIYIQPSTNNFQYYVNYAAQDTASNVAAAENTTGTFYFHYKGASKVTALYVESVTSGVTLSSMTLGGQSLSGGKINIANISGASTANISTTITAGSLGAHSDAKLKWTLYYIDKATNTARSVVAYTYCHVPLCNAAGDNSNSVISVTVHPGFERLTHTNTYTCGTAWAAGLTSVDSSGTGMNGNYDNSGSYKRNWLYNRSSSVPTCGDKKTTVFNSGIGGVGRWTTDANMTGNDSIVGGTGTLYVDSSRYTNVGQIPDFYVGIDCNNREGKSGYLYVSTGWSTSSQTIVAGDDSTDRGEGWSSGGVHPNAAITANTTTDATLYIQQYNRTTGDTARYGIGWCYVNIRYRNKTKLRTAYNYYLENAPLLNPDFFKDPHYSNVLSYLDTVTTYLCDPDDSTAQSTMDTAAANLYNLVAQLKGAVISTTDGTPSTTTFNYKDIDGNIKQNESRSTYINSSTAYNYHYSTRTTTTTLPNALINQGTNPETIPYFYGDTVYADKNNYEGYTFKYAEVTKPFDGAALVNNRSSNNNTSKPISWNPATRTLTFKNTTADTDNYSIHPGPNTNGSAYYYIPVIPKTEVTLSYKVTGPSSQVFMFGMGSDMVVPGTSWTGDVNMKSTYTNGTLTNSQQQVKWTIPENIYYVTFRFGNQTAGTASNPSETTFSDIKITLKTAVPDEINNAAGTGIVWKMYYDPNKTTVNYNPEGGTFNGITGNSTATVYYDESFRVGNTDNNGYVSTAPQKTGYEFKNWLCSVDNSTKDHGDSFTWKYDTAEVTYNAQYTPNTYTIAFNANGGSGATLNPITGVKYDEIVTLHDENTALTRTGYTFAGWKLENAGDLYAPDENGNVDVKNLTDVNNGTATLYAQWTAENFDANAYAYSNATGSYANNATGGTVKINNGTAGATATQSVACGSPYTATAAVKEGYQFSGWYSSSALTGTALTTSATYSQSAMPAYDENIYAKFDIESYNITFDHNDGTSQTQTLTGVKYGSSQDVDTPTRLGYTFKGWYTATSGGTQMYGTTSPITVKDHGNNNASVTYYAQWTPNTITVKYAGNGGTYSESMTDDTFSYGSNYKTKTNGFGNPANRVVTLNANGGSLTGGTTKSSSASFKNWKGSANSGDFAPDTYYTAAQLGVTSGEVTLTAQWNWTSVTLPAPTPPTGQKFVGWFTQESGGDERPTVYTPEYSETLFARYTTGDYNLNVYAYSNTLGEPTKYEGSDVGGTVQIGSGTAGQEASGNFLYQAPVSVTATPKTGYTFDGWFSDDALTTPASAPTKMPGNDVVLYAKFSIVTYEVKAMAYSNTDTALTTWANNTEGGTVTVIGGGVDGTEGATSTGTVVKGNTTKLKPAAKSGYAFVGWYDAAPSGSTWGTKITDGVAANGELTISNVSAAATKYARFDIYKNSLVVDPNGGSVKIGGTTYTESHTFEQAGGTTLTVSNLTPATGYTFTGWAKNPSTLNGTLIDTTYTFASDKNGTTDTITAQWSPITYTITYELDGGSDGTNHPASATYNTAFAVSAPTKSGYDFLGWTVTSGLDTANAKWGTSSSTANALDSASTKCINGTGDVYFKNLTSAVNGSVTLTANWDIKKYTVKLHAMTENNTSLGSFSESATGGTVQIDSGTAGASATATISHNSTTSLKAAAKTGYTFAGWFSDSEFKTSAGTDATLSKTVTSALEYWAKFTVNKYTITFNGNGNTGGSTASMTNCVYGITYTLTQNGFTKTGYTFDSWNTAQNGSGTAYADKASVTSLASANGANVILYAQWTIDKHTVTLHPMTEGSNGTYTESTTGGTVSGSGTFDYDTTLEISATANAGYQFDGWFSNSGMTDEATVPTKLGTSDVELWAKFSIVKYELKLYAYYNTANSNDYQNGTTGGTVQIGSTGTPGASATANVNYGTSTKITAAPATGYKFDGWYKNPTISNNVITSWGTLYNDAASLTETKNESRTYYAKFTLKSITVNYDANGGSNGAVTSATAYYGTEFTPNGNPTRPGYNLAGWAETSAAAAMATPVAASTVNNWIDSSASKTLYAVWQPYEYTISLIAATDSADEPDVFKTTNTPGGTIAYKSGVTTIKTDENILNSLNISANTGYEIKYVKYANGNVPSGDVTDWAGTTVTDSTTMGAFAAGSTVAIIAYFRAVPLNVTAYAYSNTAANANTYNNNTVGGTVKAGTAAAGATSSTTQYTGKTLDLVATSRSGYTFDGWYTNAAMTNAVPDSEKTATATKITITVADDSSNADINKRYAKFTIATLNAYVRANYYEDGIDFATGVGFNGTTGGTATVAVGSTSARTEDDEAVSVSAVYGADVVYTATAATGYDFIGWYYNDDATNNPDDEIDIADAIETESTFTITMADEDIRLVAKFVPVNFILILDPNGGTGADIAVPGATVNVTLTYNKGVTLDETAKPVRPGSAFIGWAETNIATTADYAYTDDTCEISAETVNGWYEINTSSHTIYAVWQIANYVVTLDNQGGTGGLTSVSVIVGNAMPTIESENLPTYDGYKLKGYWTEPGGNGTQYYDADGTGVKENGGTSIKKWDIADNMTLYAKWVCPVLKDAVYDEDTGWTYIYEAADGGEVSTDPSSEILTPAGITDNAPSTAKEITSIDKTVQNPVEKKNEETADINLNHYGQTALSNLLTCVTATKEDSDRKSLSQPQLNAYVAKTSYYLDLALTSNQKEEEKETYKPSVKIYETNSKLTVLKNKTIKNEKNSATGATYSAPAGGASSYVYPEKLSNRKGEAVDYYIYTNSRTPVIALELDDGEVGTTVKNNKSSYPTKATVAPDYDHSIIKGTAANDGDTFTTGAVAATDDINEAWFAPYVKAGIGVGDGTEESKKAHDYNAKTILYLTPEFVPNRMESTTDEIVYTITPEDDAYISKDGDNIIGNKGLTIAEIADGDAKADDYRAFKDFNKVNYEGDPANADSITVCVCYHNAMNGDSDEGGDGAYLKMDIDQITNAGQYADKWLNQVHLLRTAGGAANWELPSISEDVYPVDDPTFRDTGYVFGSFAYVFDATNEPAAIGEAEKGNFAEAKQLIINSIKLNRSTSYRAIKTDSDSGHFKRDGLGFFRIEGWSTNYYPKEGSYVYVHLIDRWGNVFNKVWKNPRWEDQKVKVTGDAYAGFTLNETGGSNMGYITLDGAEIEFITDLDSTYENKVFTTSGNTFTIKTNKKKAMLPVEIYDNAGNKVSGKFPTLEDGTIKLTVTDDCADLSSGAYTFKFNDVEVNLLAREPALVRKTEMPSVSISGEPTVFTITTMDRAKKVQLVENGDTITYTPSMSNVNVIENGDGTLTWTISVKPLSFGEHTFDVKCKDNAGWHDTDYKLTTKVVTKPADKLDLKLHLESSVCEIDERAVLTLNTIEGTQGVRVMFDSGYSNTISRSEVEIVSCEDGVEAWKFTSGSFNTAGDHTATVYVKYKDKWQKDDTVTCTIKVNEPVKAKGAILSVAVLDEDIHAGEKATVEVLTNKETSKLQFVLPDDTYTVSAANAKITDNGDGTLTWTIEKNFRTAGDADIILKAKSAAGWSEAANYGTVTVL